MLTIHYGHVEDELVDISGHFDEVFESEWIGSDISRRIIEVVDKSKVIRPRIIKSPILGDITPRELSGGAKGLILMAHDDDLIGTYFCGSQFGDNTLPFILEISKTRDILLTQVHYFDFPKDMNVPIHIANTGETICGYKDYKRVWHDMVIHKKYSLNNPKISNMQEAQYVRLQNKRISYDIELRYKVSIIRDNSAAGWDTLIHLADSSLRHKGVKDTSTKRLVVINDLYIDSVIHHIQSYKDDSIILMDSLVPGLASKEVADAINSSDCCFVIVTRELLQNIHYSSNAIYDLEEVGGKQVLKQVSSIK